MIIAFFIEFNLSVDLLTMKWANATSPYMVTTKYDSKH